MILSEGEAADDFHFAFKTLRAVLPLDYMPKFLIADAAEAITAGFRNVFGDGFTRVTCWAHINRVYETRLVCIKDKVIQEKINSEIHLLQACNTPELFTRASQLWLRKWEKSSISGVREFILYFRSQWLENNFGWYAGHAPLHPSTNNGLESCNRVVKGKDTLRSRLLLGKDIPFHVFAFALAGKLNNNITGAFLEVMLSTANK